MLAKWFRKKDKNDYNTHKMYNIDEFIFDDKINGKVKLFLKKNRDEFEPKLLNNYSTTDEGMMLATFPLIEELKSYYNNDLCIAVATSSAVIRNTKFNLRTNAYYAENALIRISNTWEYIFIILKEYLNIDLVVGKEDRDRIIESKCHNVNFNKSKNGYKILVTPLSDEKIREIKPILQEENKLFKISINRKKNSFHKSINNKYAYSNRLEMILQMYYCDETKDIIKLRNEFVHRRPLGAKFSLAPISFMPGQGISINPNGWYDFKNLDIKLEKNLSVIRTAIQMVVDIIFTNDVPNLKVNDGKTFFVYKVECNNCLKESLINDITVEFFRNHNELLVCPYCKENDTTVKEKIEVNDRHHFFNIREYNEFIFKYWNTKDEKRQ